MHATPTEIPIIPESAPFTPEQRAWLNGFVAGMLAGAQKTSAPAQPAQALKPLTIMFGSQTGTAEGLAKRAAKLAGQRGFAATVVDMAQAAPSRLAQERNILVITSTHGDGEPPDNAKALHAAVRSPGMPRLLGVRFAVCGLGDSNYVRFCQAAKDFDDAFEKLGAERLIARTECDVDYKSSFAAWLGSALSALGSNTAAAPGQASDSHSDPSPPKYTRKSPCPSTLMVSRPLNGKGSAKQVQHVEFALPDSDLTYEAGDALGVVPQNCPELVTEILSRLGCDGEEEVSLPDGTGTSLRLALTGNCDLGRLTPELAARLAAPSEHSSGAPAPLHVIDVIGTRPEARLKPAELVRMLRPLAPRLYSISSSPRAHTGRVHLTVGAVRYEAHGRGRKGVCSTFLCDRMVPGESQASIFVHSNKAFRLPADGSAPIIMVGPGTGIAPFRGFLHERRASGAKGKAWLFFGDQRSATDFLYADELSGFQKDGTLTRIDTAFSRDQPEKIYVQHRMLERATELFRWLEQGAHFYVCGDASRMAKDVEQALIQVVTMAGNRTPAQAADYLQALRASKRYCRDVY